MHRFWLRLSFTTLLLCACGNRRDPLASGGPASAEPASSASAADGRATEDAPRGRQRKPFSIHNSCPRVTTVVFGEDPRAAPSGRRTIALNSSIEGPRDADGKQTVWLVDDKGEPLVKVHVTRGMSQLEIGRSCRTLEAH